VTFIEKTDENSGSDLMLFRFSYPLSCASCATDLPGMVWHFLDGHGGGLSLLAAMKIAQGEVLSGAARAGHLLKP
jgi:hypothetical protein